MAITKTKQNKYRARFKFDRVTYDRTFKTARDAKIWESATRAAAASGVTGIAKKDTRRLSELCQAWFDLYGNTLRDGKNRLNKLLTACQVMGDPRGRDFTGETFANYRRARLETVGMNTVNKMQAYLAAVFSELKRLDNWGGPNPLAGQRKPAIGETDITYLTLEQVSALLAECEKGRNKSLHLLVSLILSTGARWGEAQFLRHEQVRPGKVTFHGLATKSGKTRHIPISPDLYQRLITETPATGRLFPTSCTHALKNALDRAGIELPKGQNSHVLRHTFAAHFIADGDLLTLNKLLGHSTIQQTMTYAHLAPDYLDKAIQFNPIAKL